MVTKHYSAKENLISPEFPFNICRTLHPRGHPVHTHEFFELAYVLKGRAVHIVNGQKYPISKGDIFLLNPEDSHAYRVKSHKGIEIINCFSLSSLLGGTECFKPFYNPRRCKLHLTGVLNIKIKELLETMLDELVHQRLDYKQIIKSYFTELLVILNRIFDQQEKLEKLGSMNNLRKQSLLSAIKYVETNYRENFKLNEISQKVRLTPNYFCEVFKKITGKTVIDYRNEMRIKEACHLLRSPERNITYISFEVGFNDLTYFERTFKKYTGLSPRDYRTQLNFS